MEISLSANSSLRFFFTFRRIDFPSILWYAFLNHSYIISLNLVIVNTFSLTLVKLFLEGTQCIFLLTFLTGLKH